MLIFVTDFGEVEAGPKFEALVSDAKGTLDTSSKRTKKYKFALTRMRQIEQAVSVLAEAEWVAGGVLKKTP